ncbi:SDR family NAD(P)-dependent oxidoreductase [Chitinophaga sancti]|uniref:SDR family NAD(P)-dependent oxidoreductase n=1 Tax=Chitinophaga sancti TaxID=1004 RepID=A0A1K1M292_9BACT|nr:SDR family NAD(P)-dependent oxidoreductase [Chitinophaga sancti]WQD64688.1 SDR family NAD(P)-dependent oxidoreductase [Chitinophaga sancti]WQG89690.1 SDR family NAD(P)-dependent oxidoreductase [Chitinophaga sancti]SFW17225.1 Short-chain dehydrogenase [Chitinophaga sancti]
MGNQRKTWFITGASQGIGLILVQQLLAAGYNVAATARKLETLRQAVGVDSSQFLPLQVDLVSEESVGEAVSKAITQFNTIDYLVNNAGFGLIGGIEETSDTEVRNSFDVNVFGLLNVTRAILPHMRAAQSGHIINMSSVFGLISGGGWGIYCGTKFAVEGISEALAQEVKPFGISVTIAEPGYVRTNFLSSGSIAHPAHPVAAYTALEEERRKHKEDVPGTQPGDPEKVAAAIIRLGQMSEAPLRVLMGADALQFANYKIQMLQEGIAANKEMTLSTDFSASF